MLEYVALAGGVVGHAAGSVGSSIAGLGLVERIDTLLSDPAQLSVAILIGMAGAFCLAWLLRRL
jgi:hypothetical protein